MKQELDDLFAFISHMPPSTMRISGVCSRMGGHKCVSMSNRGFQEPSLDYPSWVPQVMGPFSGHLYNLCWVILGELRRSQSNFEAVFGLRLAAGPWHRMHNRAVGLFALEPSLPRHSRAPWEGLAQAHSWQMSLQLLAAWSEAV